MFKQIVRRALVGLVSLALILLPVTPALAVQNSCIMPNTGTVSGLTLVNTITNCNNSILTLYSGASAPSGPQTYMYWADTSASPTAIKQYDGSQWNIVWYADAVGHLVLRPVGGGSTSINSATTTDLGSVPYAAKTINAVVSPITSFGSSAQIGTLHFLTFGGSVTITRNVTSMIVPGTADIAAVAGDTAVALYLGSSNWRIISFTPASVGPSAPIYTFHGNPGASVASRQDFTIPGLTQKASPVGADQFVIADSAASNALKRASLTALLALISTPQPVVPVASGLVINTSSVTPAVTANSVVMVDSSGQPKQANAVSVSINTNTIGANGLDTGSRGASAWYYIYLISNGTTTAGLASLSSTAPTMPGGYTYAMRVGAAKTDGSAVFLTTIQRGARGQYSVMPLLSSGSTGAPVAIANSSCMPPTGARLHVYVKATGIQTSDYIAVHYNGNMGSISSMMFYFSNTLGGAISASSVEISNHAEFVADPGGNFYYASLSHGTPSLSCIGWTDNINAG